MIVVTPPLATCVEHRRRRSALSQGQPGRESTPANFKRSTAKPINRSKAEVNSGIHVLDKKRGQLAVFVIDVLLPGAEQLIMRNCQGLRTKPGVSNQALQLMPYSRRDRRQSIIFPVVFPRVRFASTSAWRYRPSRAGAGAVFCREPVVDTTRRSANYMRASQPPWRYCS